MTKTRAYTDATTGDWTEVRGGSESFARMKAAKELGCDESDLREGYRHEDRDVDAEVLRD